MESRETNSTKRGGRIQGREIGARPVVFTARRNSFMASLALALSGVRTKESSRSQFQQIAGRDIYVELISWVLRMSYRELRLCAKAGYMST